MNFIKWLLINYVNKWILIERSTVCLYESRVQSSLRTANINLAKFYLPIMNLGFQFKQGRNQDSSTGGGLLGAM